MSGHRVLLTNATMRDKARAVLLKDAGKAALPFLRTHAKKAKSPDERKEVAKLVEELEARK